MASGTATSDSAGDNHLVGEPAEPAEDQHPVADGPGVDARSDGGDDAGDLAPGHERGRRLQLVSALADEPVDIVDPGGGHVDDHHAVTRLGSRSLLDHQGIEGSEFVADDGAHGGKPSAVILRRDRAARVGDGSAGRLSRPR